MQMIDSFVVLSSAGTTCTGICPPPPDQIQIIHHRHHKKGKHVYSKSAAPRERAGLADKAMCMNISPFLVSPVYRNSNPPLTLDSTVDWNVDSNTAS